MAKKKKSTSEDRMLEAIREYEEVSAELKPLEDKKTELWEEIKRLMGNSQEEIVPGFGKVTFKYDKNKPVYEVDWEVFKKEQPKIYKQYVVEDTKKGSRRLILKGLEEE